MIDDCTLLRHIAQGIEVIQNRVGDNQGRFEQDDVLQDAVLRRLETVTDACSRLSEELQARHPEIEWRAIRGLRNRLAHAYLEIQIDVLWSVIHDDLPTLQRMVDKELKRCGD